MLKNIEELRDKYWIDEDNFGMVRMGDAVGIAAFLELLRFQFNTNIRIYLPKGHSAGVLPTYLGDYFYLFYDFSLMKQLPYRGNIWGWYEYATKYYDITPKFPNAQLVHNFPMLKFCINPLFDAPYSKDRNWKPELLQKIVTAILDNYPKTATISVIASPTLTLPTLPPSVKIVQKTLGDSLRELMTSDIYIGGETGLTHFAFQVERYPKVVICLRGEKVEEYTASLTQKDKPKIFSFLTIPEGQDYAFEVCTLPRPSRDKRCLIFEMYQGDCHTLLDKIEEITDFPKPVITESLRDMSDAYKVQENGVLLEFGYSGRTVELAASAVRNNAQLLSIASSYSLKLRKAEELQRYNLYTNRIKLICEDEEQFRKNWVDTGRQWDLLVEGG